ncbi:hypothetical protein E1181_10815 [Saccharopolyspora terrae]|uniref:Uncharacterized protein n=1 Tax=Saccharopolyspora terrae TaxID=2530384 RepID=A0A4R4VX41_9PSEU|nr:hypothetical protein [Saccharopolyspora terrae]TDD07055.1 hypothetical protein E1181_10815 [Saccharopolyspora terrae]
MVDDRIQQSDRPSRKVLTGIAIAACGGVIALLVEYLVLQVWLAPEVKPWGSNAAQEAVGGVSADGELKDIGEQVKMTGTLTDRANDNKAALLIILVNDKEYRRVVLTKGAHESTGIDELLSDTASIAVRECLTHPTDETRDRRCRDPLTIWP